MVETTAEEKLAAVDTWQRCPYVHPLTCAYHSGHRLLVGRRGEGDGGVMLECRDCPYVQEPHHKLWEMVISLHRKVEEYGGHPMDDRVGRAWRSPDERG